MHEPFSTFARRVKKYRDPRTGLRLLPISLDTLNEQLGNISGKRVSSKAKAIRIAQTALDRGLVFGSAAEAKREESKA